MYFFFFFNDTATTEIYTLSLHDALPISPIALKDALAFGAPSRVCRWRPGSRMAYCNSGPAVLAAVVERVSGQRFEDRSEEHTSELQSLRHLVCRLLLEKKKKCLSHIAPD